MRVGRVFVESMTLVALLGSACTSESAPRHAPTPATSGSSRNSSSAASGVAVLLDREPVVGPSGDEAFVNPGAIVFHGGRFHMLANSFTDYPGPSTVRHLTSEDGIRWRAASTKPIFSSSEVPFGDQNNAFFMSAYVESGGDWVAFFYTFDGVFSPGFIGRATAPRPDGPWRVDRRPVLQPGTEGAWDSSRLAEPSVVRTPNEFLLYYAGFGDDGVSRIGLATSPDGRTWEKYDDPATTDAPFAVSDPVLEGSQEWDAGSVDGPQVVLFGQGFILVYDSAAPFQFSEGVARSQDGIRWEPSPSNPIITDETSPDEEPIWQSEAVLAADRLLLWLEVGFGRTTTNVYAYRLDLQEAFPSQAQAPQG